MRLHDFRNRSCIVYIEEMYLDIGWFTTKLTAGDMCDTSKVQYC